MHRIDNFIHESVQFLRYHQLSTGELPAVADWRPGRPDVRGRFVVPNLFISTFIHDALNVIIAVGEDLVRDSVRQLQLAIQRFLQHHEEFDHVWKFLGKGSHMDPDADTTARAVLGR